MTLSPTDLVAIADAMEPILDEARSLVLRMRGGEVARWYKGEDDPVTEIDMAVDGLLRTRLMDLVPHTAWLSEETEDDLSRLDASHVWIVDPIDGTRTLLGPRPEFGISVALAVDGAPAVAFVDLPTEHARYRAVLGHGATLDGRAVTVSTDRDATKARIVVSRYETAKGYLAFLDETHRLEPLGSIANKMAVIAHGDSAGTFTPFTRAEWDVAGGTLLVTEAGGTVTDGSGAPLVFNRRDTRLRGLVVSNGLIHDELVTLSERVAARHAAADTSPTV